MIFSRNSLLRYIHKNAEIHYHNPPPNRGRWPGEARPEGVSLQPLSEGGSLPYIPVLRDIITSCKRDPEPCRAGHGRTCEA